MKKFVTYTKGGNRFGTYHYIWIGNLFIDLSFKKRKPLTEKFNEWFRKKRTVTIKF